jgi:alkanesulfonate monooxygenase SsuD/methylene tetrahydromethanopterin reductase-like flavin-dependent oxidoreductase (luciferase family)
LVDSCMSPSDEAWFRASDPGRIGAPVGRHYSAVMAPIAPVAQRLAGLGLCLGLPDERLVHDDILDWASAAAVAAELAGFTSVWATETMAEPPEAVPYEAFSLISALAVRTRTVHLGVLAEADQRRVPSILSKIVTSVDVISHGRAVLSLAGDRSVPADAHRLGEALAIARAMLEEEHPTVEGRIYSVADAINRPAPVQVGGIPLVVFLHGTGPGVAALEVCARSADAVVVAGGATGVGEVLSFLGDRKGPRDRPGDRVGVLGRVGADDPSAAADVAAVRNGGADGCLICVAAPWSVSQIEGLGLTW